MDKGQGNYMCETGLSLGLAIGGGNATAPATHSRQPESGLPLRITVSRKPSLTLSLSNDMVHGVSSPTAGAGDVEVNYNKFSDEGRQACQSSPHSALSSFSTVGYPSPIKKEKGASEEVEIEKGSSRGGSDEDDDGSARKKLRLTKEQSALLEDRFKEHSTLNPKQKQALARQLNLRPRQVEVWFQNRRARTKLKQTEVDCEFLKRCCERLTDENRRLQKELQELKALKFAPQLYMQYPAATLTMCPSCERLGGSGDGPKSGNGAGGPFALAPKSHFFNPFTHSAAC